MSNHGTETTASLGFRQSVAVVIGIDVYTPGIPALQSAVNDARRLAALLAEEHGYQVQLLVEQVTGPRLAALFAQELPARLGPDDRLLVYFAGHGIALDGDEGPAGYLIPQDARPGDAATYIAMTDLNDWLTALPCRHLLLILDCCFAGAFRWSSTRHVSAQPRVLYRERYDRFLHDPAWEVLTSAAYDQTAFDVLSRLGGRPGDGDHSPFALALFAALAGGADLLTRGEDGVARGDGVMTAPELYVYLRDQVESEALAVNQRQTPGLWPLRRHGKGEYIFLVPGQTPELPPAPALTTENNPYRGLESYDERHQALFFGRDELIQRLQAKVYAEPLAVVTGVSGSGKSSLVKAGLLPHLRTAAAQPVGNGGGSLWQIAGPLRPGTEPLRALAALFDAPPEGFDLAAALQGWTDAHPGLRLVLVIDQLEELVTLAGEAERATMVQQVAAALAAHQAWLRVVLTVRSDFEPQFTSGPLGPLWAAGRFLVPPMTQDELREVIVQPAAARVLYFQPDELVDRIINDVVQMPGALPLLSFTLSELYLRYVARAGGDRALTAADYDALGGVAGALRTRANAEYGRMDPLHQRTMRRLLLRMVSLEGNELTRRRVRRAELDYSTTGENGRVDAVVRQLAEARLVVTGQDEGGEAYVEPAHDALVQAWDTLWAWVRAEQENLVLQRRLTPAALDWVRGGRAAGLLWDDDPRLRQAEAAATASDRWLNRMEEEFVAASVRRRQRNMQTLIGSLVAAVLVFAGLAGFALVQRNDATAQRNEAFNQSNARATQEAIAIAERDEAQRQQALSRSRELAVVAQSQLPDDPELGILVALAANTVTRTFESEDVLRRAVRASPLRAVYGGTAKEVFTADITVDRLLVAGTEEGRAFVEVLALPDLRVLAQFPVDDLYAVYDATFSPDSSRVLALGDDDRLRVWEVASGALLLSVPAYRAVWSPDGSEIVSAGDNLAADVWDVAAGQLHITVGERADGIYDSVQFSPDGTQIVTTFAYTSSGVYTAKVWDIAGGEQVAEFPADAEIAFSPDGQLLAHGDGNSALIRETRSYAPLQAVTSENLQDVFFTRFSPSSQYLVTASTDGTVRVWHIGREQITRRQLFRVDALPAIDAFAELAEFSPDERMLVTVGGSRVQLRDLVSGNVLATLPSGEHRIYSAQFSPDGRYLVTLGDDGTARLWSGRLDEEWLNLPGDDGYFAPDGTSVATVSGATLRLWDVANGQMRATPLESMQPVRGSFFSPDATRIYAVGDSGVTWWETANGRMIGERPVQPDTLLQAVLSPDGRWLATVAEAEPQAEDPLDPDVRHLQVAIWNAVTGAAVTALHDLPAYRSIQVVAFSPDGSLLLLSGPTSVDEGGSNGVVRVWNAATGVLRYALDFGSSAQVQFSPDGSRVVTVSDSEIGLWQAVDGAAVTTVTADAPLSTEPVSFSADGTRLGVIDGFSWSARVWDLESGQPLSSLRGHRGRLDRIQLAPDGALILTSSSGDGTVRLWDGRTGELRSVLQAPSVRHAELSPDGRYVLAAGGGDVKLALARFADLLALGQARVTRGLTCTEERDLLHEPVECVVVTPPPVSD